MLRRLWIGSFEVVLALASFALGSILVRALAPYASDGHLAAKLEHFEEHADEYDAVVLGASRVFRGLDTRMVEEELAAEGVQLKIFNFGASGMWTFEQDYLLHELLARDPARLRWIFYGGRPIGLSNPFYNGFEKDANLFSERGIQWHTLEETGKVLATIRCLPLTPGEKLDLALLHVELCARNLSNVGRGFSILRHWFRSKAERGADRRLQEHVREQRGYFGLGGPENRPRAREMRDAMREPERYHARVALIPEQNALPFVLEEVDVDVYHAQQRAAREQGAELVYFTAPGFEGSPERLRLHELGILPELWHFNDPERYPELFLIDERFDPSHLNRAGTERFSRLFGAAILERVRAERDATEE